MTEQISADMQDRIREFQEVQQQLRLVMSQKYQLDAQLKESDAVVSELEKTDKPEIHRAIGQVLIRTDKDTVLKDMKERQELVGVRVNALEKQESKLKERLQSLQDRLKGIITPVGE